MHLVKRTNILHIFIDPFPKERPKDQTLRIHPLILIVPTINKTINQPPPKKPFQINHIRHLLPPHKPPSPSFPPSSRSPSNSMHENPRALWEIIVHDVPQDWYVNPSRGDVRYD